MKQTIKLSGSKDLAVNDVNVLVENITVNDEISYPSIKTINVISSLDKSATVTLKIKQNRQVITLNCGTLGNTSLPDSAALKTFVDGAKLKVSVLLCEGGSQKVLARLKRPISISIDDTEDSTSPFSFGTGLTDPWLWQLETLDQDIKPRILLSNKIEIKDKIKGNPIFLVSIFPQAIRESLSYIWKEELFDEDGDWIPIWRDLTKALKVRWPDENEDVKDIVERDTWIDQIIEEFLTHNKSSLFDKAIEELNLEDEV